MRIVCPRCVAQYEVDESAIPQAGREVQCANCENIWFQDYIEMLPTSDDDTGAVLEEDRGVFDDLDGKSDANFYSSRGDSTDEPREDSSDREDDTDDEYDTNILADDPEDTFDDEDDAPNANIPIPPVDEDVLDVLRSEAAFSSARDQLDSAAADALDGNGEEIKATLDDTLDAPDEIDDLTAFLDAHSDDAPTPEADSPTETDETPEDAPTDPSFDPLADLEAIRSQLNDIGAEEPATEYTPNLPADDPIDPIEDEDEDDEDVDHSLSADMAPPPDSFDAEIAEIIEESADDYDAQQDEPEYDDDTEFDATSLTAALDIAGQDRPELDEDFDDEEEDRPRHAYRADGKAAAEETVADDDDVEDEIDTSDEASDEPDVDTRATAAAAVAGGAAAAVGLTRPRSKGTRSRARAMPGFETAPAKATEPDLDGEDVASDTTDDLSAVITDAADRVADLDEETLEAAVDTSRRPKRERKARLPDVDELDASLRSEEEPRRRDREMMDAHEEDLAKAGKGGFRRAFIWTLFIIALLIALYILRPQILEVLPAAAVVLDPYAAFVDNLRGMINGLLG